MSPQAERLKSEEAPGGSSAFQMPGVFARVAEYPRRWRLFLHEVKLEMRQVTWPTWNEIVSTTFVVIVTVAFFGIFFFGVDSTVGYFVQRVINLFTH